CVQRLDDALRRLCDELPRVGESGMRVDFAHGLQRTRTIAQQDACRSAEIRRVAMRHARRVWNHALESLVSARVAAGAFGEWKIHTQGMWRNATPHGCPVPRQGWKIHVSAT